LLLIGRSVNPEATFLVFGLLLVLSKAWRLFLQKVFATGVFSQRIIFLGTNECVRKIYMALTCQQKAKQGDNPLTAVAIADWQGSSCSFALQPETPYVALNTCSELVALTEKINTRKVMVCKQVADSMTAEEVCTLKHQGVQFCVDDEMHEAITGWRDPAGLDPRKLVFSESFQHSIRRFFKRTSDIVIAAMLLVILSPVMLAIIVKRKWSSAGKVFKTRPCVGMRKKSFNRYFFSFSKPISNALFDKFVPGLPQLWNVLCGDMSLVGPLPITPDESETITRDLLIFDERYTVRPGMTGWAQVNCTGDASATHFKHMFGYDLFYLGHLSLFMDIVVLMRASVPQMSAGVLVEDNSFLLREK
jgi:lipopolysaccharide/colanic/teichoic acid biosynthesis glycosyltransferase